MAATPIIASGRYFARGLTRVVYCPVVANVNAPTRAEINAGTDLTPEISEVNGWDITSNEIETPDLATVFTSKIPGSTSIGDSSLTMYADDNGADVRGVLPRGTSGKILMMYGGDIVASKMDVFPIRVRSVGKPVALGDDAATVALAFSITAQPAENVAVPA
jgi:hypothetical protein